MSEYLYTTPALDRSVELRRHVMTTAMRCFGGWGYREIQVPLLHYFEALRPGLDDEQIERSFRFVDRAGNLIVLRPDVTPIIAQTFAQMRSPSLPLRVSYTHKVVRLERSFTRDQLESYQLGAELLGGDVATSDMEMLLVALEVLGALELPSYQIQIADHALATHLLRASGAPPRLRRALLDGIIARDTEEVRGLLDRLGTRAHFVEALLAMASLQGGREQIERVRRALPDDPRVGDRLDHLCWIDETLNSLGYYDHIHLNLAELGGASYYSGVSFSMSCEGSARELGRGGRYDDLTSAYGKPVPATGVSFSLETLIQALHPNSARVRTYAEPEDMIEVEGHAALDGLRRALEQRARGQRVRLHTPSSRNGRGGGEGR